MPILNFIRSVFGRDTIPDPHPSYRFDEDTIFTDSFRNPIWESDEDDDDVSDFSYNYRQPRNRHQYQIDNDPFEITRFFERKMEDMMRSFFEFEGVANLFNENWGSSDSNDFSNALPMPDDQPSTSGPRDEVLKPSHDSPNSLFGCSKNGKGPCDEVLKPSYAMPDANTEKLDSDIDGKIKSDQLAKIWTSPSQEVTTSKPQFSIRSFGSSVSTQFVKRPDGSVEQTRTVRDSEGNEEIVVTRQIGDKIHTITKKKSKDGSEVKTEDIVNMDEGEFKGFDEKWSKPKIISKDDGGSFSWYKFFFGPKL